MRSLILLTLLFLTGVTFAQTVNVSNTSVQEYIVVGPFHAEGIGENEYLQLLDVDFLGGEANWRPETAAEVVEAEAGWVQLHQLLGDSAGAAAYAYFEIDAEKDGNAAVMIEARDGVVMYLNGEMVATYFGRNPFHWVEVELKAGVNPVLVKVVNQAWDWGLKIELYDMDQAAQLAAGYTKDVEYRQFQEMQLTIPKGENGYGFYPGQFPMLLPEHPGLAREYLGGGYEIKVRWFDRELNEVLFPAEPGRYAYYAEVVGENGLVLKRSATLFCMPERWMGWPELMTSSMDFWPVHDVSEDVWQKHTKAISQFSGAMTFQSFYDYGEGAKLLAFLDEMHRQGLDPERSLTPEIFDGDYHAALKQKIIGKTWPEIAPPSLRQETATILEPLEHAAETYEEMYAELDSIGDAWMADLGGAFDMLIAQHGKILYHRSFGEDVYGEFTNETSSEIASISKLMTGMLFAQFVDQDIIDIDDPVGKYLPDLPATGPQALTMRDLFTHTNGFEGHGRYGAARGHWLENTLLHELDDTVGVLHRYNGMGYNLAGSVMEAVAGKDVFRLLRENLYEPLEMSDTYHDYDLAFSCQSTAYDLAKVAQMLLNKGSYGDLQFFSEDTYRRILPSDLLEKRPNLVWSNGWDQGKPWGIGITHMDWRVQDEQSGEWRALISDEIYGHGSATASVFWVIPEHDMIITQSRRKAYRNYGIYGQQMFQAIDKHLIKEQIEAAE